MSRKGIDLTGQRFGRLLVIKATKKRHGAGSVVWECICDCGKRVFVSSSYLRSNGTRSCGCLASENGRRQLLKLANENRSEWIEGLKNRWKDPKYKKDMKLKFAKSANRLRGPESPSWRGKNAPYPTLWKKEIKPEALKRDNWTCQSCRTKVRKKLVVHHRDFNNRNNTLDNAITLCVHCHGRIHARRRGKGHATRLDNHK